MQYNIGQMVTEYVKFPYGIINRISKHLQRPIGAELGKGPGTDIFTKEMSGLGPVFYESIIPDQSSIIPDKSAFQ